MHTAWSATSTITTKNTPLDKPPTYQGCAPAPRSPDDSRLQVEPVPNAYYDKLSVFGTLNYAIRINARTSHVQGLMVTMY